MQTLQIYFMRMVERQRYNEEMRSTTLPGQKHWFLYQIINQRDASIGKTLTIEPRTVLNMKTEPEPQNNSNFKTLYLKQTQMVQGHPALNQLLPDLDNFTYPMTGQKDSCETFGPPRSQLLHLSYFTHTMTRLERVQRRACQKTQYLEHRRNWSWKDS